jgi:hypothetical protein
MAKMECVTFSSLNMAKSVKLLYKVNERDKGKE